MEQWVIVKVFKNLWISFEMPFSSPLFPCSSIERRIYSFGKTSLCFVVFLIGIQPLFLCYFGKWGFNTSAFRLYSFPIYLRKICCLHCCFPLSFEFTRTHTLTVVSISRLIWRNFLMLKNQHLTFVKKDNLRTFSYTVRNPGIVNIILHLQGEPNVQAIRDGVNRTVLEKKTKSGELLFPKLSAQLVTCWGFYAWNMSPE